MKLYHIDPSPPARACRMVAEILNLDLELVLVDLNLKAQYKSDFLKINPTHTVPVLDNNGFILWDSHAIMTYFCNKYAKDDSLYPKNPEKRAIVDQILHFDNGTFFSRLAAAVRPMFYKNEKTLSNEVQINLSESYCFLDKILDGKKWVAGDDMSIADISLYASAVSINAIYPIDTEEFANVIRWMHQCAELPCAKLNEAAVKVFASLVK